MTGKTSEEAEATAFVPQNDSGRLQIEGLEADQYLLTETATDRGYNLLREPVEIDITATDRDVIASVCGVTGMDQEAVEQIVKNYNGGIYDENGNLVTDQLDELTGTAAGKPVSETANGRTIGKTDLYVGAIRKASAKSRSGGCIYDRFEWIRHFDSNEYEKVSVTTDRWKRTVSGDDHRCCSRRRRM